MPSPRFGGTRTLTTRDVSAAAVDATARRIDHTDSRTEAIDERHGTRISRRRPHSSSPPRRRRNAGPRRSRRSRTASAPCGALGGCRPARLPRGSDAVAYRDSLTLHDAQAAEGPLSRARDARRLVTMLDISSTTIGGSTTVMMEIAGLACSTRAAASGRPAARRRGPSRYRAGRLSTPPRAAHSQAARRPRHARHRPRDLVRKRDRRLK